MFIEGLWFIGMIEIQIEHRSGSAAGNRANERDRVGESMRTPLVRLLFESGENLRGPGSGLYSAARSGNDDDGFLLLRACLQDIGGLNGLDGDAAVHRVVVVRGRNERVYQAEQE